MDVLRLDENQIEQIDGMTVEYPYCMHRRDLTDIVIPWHWHEELELGYLDTGTSVISTLNAEYTVHQGDGFFINTNVMDTKRNASPGQRALEINHIFHPIFLSGHFKSRFETKYLNPILKNRQIEVHVIRRGHPTGDAILANLMRLRELQAGPDSEFQTRSLLSETWLLLDEELKTCFRGGVQTTENENRLRQMLMFIHSRYAEKITLAQLAACANLSERETLRCFKRGLRQSPMEYLTAYRLNAAKKLLEETDMPMTEIAFRCGFSDAAYFSKMFHRETGLPPKAYRQTKKAAFLGQNAASSIPFTPT